MPLSSKRKRTIAFWLGCLILPSLLLALLFRGLNRTQGESGAHARMASVASFLSGDVVLLLHVPRLRDAEAAWREADAWRVWTAPPVAAFLEKPLACVPELDIIREHWAQTLALDPADAFLALTLAETPEAELELLAAFKTRADDESFEVAWENAHAWLRSRMGENVRENVDEAEGMVYRTFEAAPHSVVLANGAGWCFLSNQRRTIERALARHREGNNSSATLIRHPLFKRALNSLPRDYLSAAYLRPIAEARLQRSVESLSAHGAAMPRFTERMESLFDTANRAEIEAIAMTSSVRDHKMVDFTSFLVAEGSPVPSQFTGESMRYTAPDTLAYFATTLGGEKLRQRVFAPLFPVTSADSDQIGDRRPSVKTFNRWFHPEWSLQVEPVGLQATGAKRSAVPALGFTLRDPGAFRAFADSLARKPGNGIRRVQLDTYTMPADHLPKPWPSLVEDLHFHLSDSQLFVSNDPMVFPTLRDRVLKSDGPVLSDRAEFKKLRRQLPAPDLAIGFIDSRRLLARGYEALQHPLIIGALWMSLRSQTSLEVDFKKLPRTGAVGRHLTPTLLVVRRTPGGYQQASVGSLSPSQWAFAGAIVASLVDDTFMQPLADSPPDPFVTPLETRELETLLNAKP